jgi:hypothetical protein
MTEFDEWWAALLPFHENPKDAEPDVKALSRMLRSDKPLPEGLREQIAELLDSQWRARSPLARACNWQLRPTYVGWREKVIRKAEQEGRVLKALEAAPKITAATAKIDDGRGMSQRTAFSAWTRIKAKRAFWERVQAGIRQAQEMFTAKRESDD